MLEFLLAVQTFIGVIGALIGLGVFGLTSVISLFYLGATGDEMIPTPIVVVFLIIALLCLGVLLV